MQFLPIKTRRLLPPKDDLMSALDEALPKLKEGDILLITSKVLAIHQGRCLKKIKNKNFKLKIIRQEADYILPMHKVANSDITLTIKDHTLIPTAGIDESNGNGYYILWPKNTNQLLKKIAVLLKKKHKIKKLGLIATDSHTTPLRHGVTGIATGLYGFEPVSDKRGTKDLFGRKLKVTWVNIVDALAAMSVLLMGEGKEQTPALIIRGANFVKFTNKNTYKKLIIDPEKDLYYPILKQFSAKGGSASGGKNHEA